MNCTLVIPHPIWRQLCGALLRPEQERAAALVGFVSTTVDGAVRLLINRLELPLAIEIDYERELTVQLNPRFVARLAKAARLGGESLVFVHTHPFQSKRPSFSSIDDAGEQHLRNFMTRRAVPSIALSMVVSPGGVTARKLGTDEQVAVEIIGEKIERYDGATPGHDFQGRLPANDLGARHRVLFSKDGLARIETGRFAVVGCGGTGSVVVEQLAYLGVRNLVLVDPDLVEKTNLNRLVGAGDHDVGKLKVDVLAGNLRNRFGGIRVQTIAKNVLDVEVIDCLKDCRSVFSCVDTHGARSLLNQFAYQHLVPVVDMGSVVVTKEGIVDRIFGRAQLLSPGLACLACTGVLDSDRVRWDFMSEKQAKQDPYFIGEGDPAPAVIVLNSIVSSLAVSIFLACVADYPFAPRFLLHDGVKGLVKPIAAVPDPACAYCSARGVLARGDRITLPHRASG